MKLLFKLLLAVACGGLQAAEPTAGNADIAQFIKENGRFVSRLDADVTGDGVPDTIVVLANDKRIDATVTVLIGLDAERTSTTLVAKLSWNALTGSQLFRTGDRNDKGIRYGPESRSVHKPGTVYMSLSPTPDELIDRALAERKKK